MSNPAAPHPVPTAATSLRAGQETVPTGALPIETPTVPFYIGVTGHMDLESDDRAKVEQTLRSLFDWLRGDQPQGERFPGPGLGLKHTPLVVLSSLAPGADHWVAAFASQKDALSGDKQPRASVLSPLPFLPKQYVQASTFHPKPDKAPTEDAGPEEHQRHARNVQQGKEAVDKALAFFDNQPPENLFLVRLPQEIAISKDQRVPEVKCSEDQVRAAHEDPELLTGEHRQAERRHRYGAAGEYVAAYSDLLLVLADPLDRAAVEEARRKDPTPHLPDVGTHGIADVRRRGLTPGRLPIRPALSWADSGPVLRITAFRRKTRVPKDERAKVGATEWLFPFDSRPRGVDQEADVDPRWEARGLGELRDFARNLEDFNADRLPPEKAVNQNLDEEWYGRLHPKRVAAEPGTEALPKSPAADEPLAAGILRRELRRIGQLRRWAADLNRHHDDSIRLLRGSLFLTALSAALLLAFYEYWQFPSDPAAAATHAGASALPHGAEPVTVWRWVFFWGSLGFTLLAFGLVGRFRGKARDRTRTDYRAIAEGLRVQLYWAAAGTGQSVSSAYLQRQRGELTWIRSAIASAAFPYERSAVAFAALPPRTQHRLLKEVREGWLGEQGRYFRRRVREFRELNHFWGGWSQVLIWTALTLSVVGFLLSATPVLKEIFTLWRDGFLAMSLVGFVTLAFWTHSTPQEPPSDSEDTAPRKERASGVLQRLVHVSTKGLEILIVVLSKVLPRLEGEQNKTRRHWARALTVTAVSLLFTGASYRLGEVGIFPSAARLLGFCKAVSLSVGLLAGLWAAVHFYTDNIRSYGEMGELFKAANRRLGEHLHLLESALDAHERPPDLTPQELAKRALTLQELAKRALTDSQELLVDLGRETLHENSGWLSMHRDRPIEPVSA